MPLIVASLNVYATDRDEAKQMLDFAARKYGDYSIGVTAAYPSNWSQLAQYKQQSFIQIWVKSSLQSSEKEVGVFNEDTDSDGKFDRCYPVAFMQFAHGLAEY